MALALPFVAMMDTTVFLCRLGEKPENPDSLACIDFCDRMVSQRRSLWVSAPTITEVTRGAGKETPKVPGIGVVPFDERAATKLGLALSADDLKRLRNTSVGRRSLPHVKYDAFVIGCALRIPSCTFVTMDGEQLSLAQRCGLAAHHPRDFCLPPPPPQGLFPFDPPPDL